MRESDEVVSRFLDKLHVANVETIGNGVAESGSILMAIYSAESEVFSIQRKTFLAVEGVPAKSERLLDLVDYLAA